MQFNLRIAACCLAALCIDVTHAQAPTNAPDEVAGQPAPAAEVEPGADAIILDPILIPERRPQDIGPMPGLGLTREEIPSNVQSITAKEIRDSNSLSLTDLMNSQMQSVTVNDYQGNPFQVDVQFRGFTAGPQVGTPQGLSVFLDGIRMNELFGDVVFFLILRQASLRVTSVSWQGSHSKGSGRYLRSEGMEKLHLGS